MTALRALREMLARHVSLRPLWRTLRYSSAMPIRWMLAICALLWAVFMLTSPAAMAGDPVYQAMFRMMPREAWAAAFGVDGVLLLWRIVDVHPRIGATRLINSATVGLWSVFLCLTTKVYGSLPPDAADAFGILLAAMWATLRTDLTLDDRENA